MATWCPAGRCHPRMALGSALFTAGHQPVENLCPGIQVVQLHLVQVSRTFFCPSPDNSPIVPRLMKFFFFLSQNIMISDMPWASLPFFWDRVGLSHHSGVLFFSNTVLGHSCVEYRRPVNNHTGHCCLPGAPNQIVCACTRIVKVNKRGKKSERYSLEVCCCRKAIGRCPLSLAGLKDRKKCIRKAVGGKRIQPRAVLIGSC